MTRFGLVASFFLSLTLAGLALLQPPGDPKGKGGKGKDKGGPGGGPPRFELGRTLPPGLREELNLTKEQEKALDAIEQELKEKLNKLLTEEQKKAVENFRPRGPGGPGGPGGGPGGEARPDRAPLEAEPDNKPAARTGPKVTTNKGLKAIPDAANPTMLYTLTGDADETSLGDQRKEHSGHGIRFPSGEDANKGRKKAGSSFLDYQRYQAKRRPLVSLPHSHPGSGQLPCRQG